MGIVANEYGKTIVLDCGFDLSGQTGLSLIIDRPNGTTLSLSGADGLAVGNSDLVINSVTYSANQYVTYTLADGDLPVSGEHKRKLSVSFPSKRLVTITEAFTVEA